VHVFLLARGGEQRRWCSHSHIYHINYAAHDVDHRPYLRIV